MLNRSLLLVVVSLLFASSTLAQFVPSNRLTDAAARLSRDAEDFANASYNNYSNSGRNGRNEIDAMMTAQLLGASARISIAWLSIAVATRNCAMPTKRCGPSPTPRIAITSIGTVGITCNDRSWTWGANSTTTTAVRFRRTTMATTVAVDVER